MHYQNIVPAVFHSRPNRFIALVEIDGEITTVHVKNTGRCRELLLPGAKVILAKADNPNRKTQYDLIAVSKGDRLINMDSQAPNQVFFEYLEKQQYISGITLIKREVTHGDSRFDFYAEAGERRIFIEVKGVTLEENGIVLFPDAPTLRGVKHLNGLVQCVAGGFEAHVVFVIQMAKVRYFTPNNQTHPAFGNALSAAVKAGVKAVALDCLVTPDSLVIDKEVPIQL
jgi:sugar fermentation stimulation protein A